MKTRILLTAGILVMGAAAGPAGPVAQAQDLEIAGRVITTPIFDIGRQLMLSQGDNIYGTARSAAMGGAFTSLGADLSSMSINPAGLGMYQSSDIGLTQALSIDRMKTASDYMRPGALSSGGTRISYGINNLGAAFNLLNRSGTLTSLTLGISYNRTANFNSRTRVSTRGEDSSIAQMFQNQLNLMESDPNNPIGPNDLKPSAHPFYNNSIYLDEWGAVMAYQTGLVRHTVDGYERIPGAEPSDSYFGSVVRGGIFDYGVSLGANLNNFLYLGATINASQIDYREETSYEESYPTSSSASFMWLDQSTRIAGSGISAKIGAVVRPIPALRLGLAFHLPTYYQLDTFYAGAMGVGSSRADTADELVDRLEFNSAPKLLTGISGIIADRAILSLDYEVVWYNKMGQQSASLYKPAQTIRAGLEVRASDMLSIRLGGSRLFDFMKQKELVANNPTVRSAYTFSAGLGTNFGDNFYLDASYVYNRSRYTNYEFFYLRDGDIVSSQYDTVNGDTPSREYTPTRNHHMIVLTIGSRF